jgi:hypothetical protein
MTRKVALTILAAAGLFAQYVDPSQAQAIHNRRAAEAKRQQYLRHAFNFDQSYQRCLQTERRKKTPNPHACEHFRIKAKEQRALAASVQTIPVQPSRNQPPMYSNYDLGRAAGRQYPVGQRPPLPPQMIPSTGQIVQGAWHGLQNGQTTFQTDSDQLSDQPAIDYRDAMGGNAGAQNGQSTFGSNVGSGGFAVPGRNVQTPRYVPAPRPVQRPHYPRRVRQGHYRNGRIVY